MSSDPRDIAFAPARAELRELGIVLSRLSATDEYRVRVKGSPAGEGYYTNDLTDAYQTGHQMATRLGHGVTALTDEPIDMQSRTSSNL